MNCSNSSASLRRVSATLPATTLPPRVGTTKSKRGCSAAPLEATGAPRRVGERRDARRTARRPQDRQGANAERSVTNQERRRGCIVHRQFAGLDQAQHRGHESIATSVIMSRRSYVNVALARHASVRRPVRSDVSRSSTGPNHECVLIKRKAIRPDSATLHARVSRRNRACLGELLGR